MAKRPDRDPAKHSKKDPAKPTRAKAARPDVPALDPSLADILKSRHRSRPRGRRFADRFSLPTGARARSALSGEGGVGGREGKSAR